MPIWWTYCIPGPTQGGTCLSPSPHGGIILLFNYLFIQFTILIYMYIFFFISVAFSIFDPRIYLPLQGLQLCAKSHTYTFLRVPYLYFYILVIPWESSPHFKLKGLLCMYSECRSFTHLRVLVDFFVPLEVWSDSQFDLQRWPCDWLDVDRQLQLGELVHVLVDGLAKLGHSYELSDFVVSKVKEAFPRYVLLLNLLDDLIRNLLELT